MTRYLADFRIHAVGGGLYPYIQMEGEPLTTLSEVVAAIAENHVANDRRHGFLRNYDIPGGVFRCLRIEEGEGTCRDVTEEVLEAYRKQVLDDTGEEPWWLATGVTE